ncbi:unnamed protein product [Miscanthus lutarioriparius]|uniref:Lipoxygenase n=1 Tax=Miscanthus lutarioriparius TaxID=422564 RepID=A0A811PJW6_9POAL|nr:unnamed protein product [Miscanthus lutarioriparius]
MINLNLKQPLMLPAHQSNVVGSRLASWPSAAAVVSRRRGGGVSSSSSRSRSSRRHMRLPRISCSATEEVSGAVASVTVEQMLTVSATVEASPAIGQMYFQRALDDVRDLLGKTLLMELVSSELDAKTGLEKPRVTAFAHKTLREGHYEAEFKVPASFGPVGAVLVENEHHKEIFIREIKLVTGGDSSTAVTFDCNSWVHSKFDKPEKRIFFTLKSYLPSDTPKGLEDLRKKDLQELRGDGSGERKAFERVYDYDVYNDLGDPDKNPDHQRPILGGSKRFPYPRRCRTGRARTKRDPQMEKRDGHHYVPRDEQFSEVKQLTFGATTLRSGLHALLPAIRPMLVKKELRFPHFPAIDELYSDGIPLPAQTGLDAIRSVVPRVVKLVGDTTDHVLRFEVPEMIERDRFSWFKDEEFARQTIAGLNPLCIKLLTEFPIRSKLDPEVYGPAESAITKEILEKQMNCAMTVEQALAAKRLFILDYHDVFLPYVHRVRELPDTTLYGSRTVFFLTDLGTLLPLAIELTRPKSPTKPQWKRVFTHGPDATDAWLWKLAKAHVLTHDTGYHQLVSHWLRTHCCVEPYIIAANRQLSRLHPVYRLLHPHFRYTMEINALAREALINADGIIEESFWPGKYAMELCSVAYGATWQFDTEALPNDLVKRGLAVRRDDGELELTIKDYPYAHDGLMVWNSIRQWAADYVNVYYKSDEAVAADPELKAFWDEVRNVGHGDKKDEPWWPVLNTRDSLVETLTTIMWVTSAHHSAVNFGQYHFGGYFPNRPTTIRKNMPVEEGQDEEMKKFLTQPETTMLEMLPTQMQAIRVMTTLDILSSHSPDEEYMGSSRSRRGWRSPW